MFEEEWSLALPGYFGMQHNSQQVEERARCMEIGADQLQTDRSKAELAIFPMIANVDFRNQCNSMWVKFQLAKFFAGIRSPQGSDHRSI